MLGQHRRWPMSEPGSIDVLTASSGSIGSITLNRPRSLNALTTGMVTDIARNLQHFRAAGCQTVVIRSAHSRVFCAGGDVRRIRSYAMKKDFDAVETFFSTEYEMDYDIATSSVPVATIVDGVCLGGGMGIFGHSKIRVVTEDAVLGMPENAIGFFPDVGASYFLSRLPGALGMYIALTGHRLTAADALYCGLATHAISSNHAVKIMDSTTPPSLASQLCSHALHIDTASSYLAANRREIDRCFEANTLTRIFTGLADLSTPWGKGTLDVLKSLSPQSLHATFKSMTQAQGDSLRRCLDRDLDTALRLTRTPDFIEGVGAKLVDKRTPHWTSRCELNSTAEKLEGTWRKP